MALHWQGFSDAPMDDTQKTDAALSGDIRSE